MIRKQVILASVFVLTTLIAPQLSPSIAQVNPAEPTNLDQVEVSELSQKLIALDKYMTRNQTTNAISFDIEAAKRDGVSKRSY